MNPFSAFDGIRLNGKHYPKEELSKSIQKKSLYDIERDALEFAMQVFDKSSSLSVKTSGSTGKPKTKTFRKKAFVASAKATNAFFDLNESSTALLALPLKYIAGKMMVIRAIVGQYNLLAVSPSGNPFTELGSVQIDFAPITPFQASQILIDDTKKLAEVGAVLIGGGQISHELKATLNRAGVRAFASFGMTETLSHFAIADLNIPDEEVEYKWLKGVGVKTDKNGNLKIKWPDITGGWLQTNDLVKMHESGFQWLGRTDNLINSGGVKIIPEVVEKRISSLIKMPYFVAGVPHKTLGEALTLFVESDEEGLKSLRLSEIQNLLRDMPFWQPREIVGIEKFRYTPSGKIKRKTTLRAWLKQSKKT
jgi:O-succinylbenzoic acid--CoA ligase